MDVYLVPVGPQRYELYCEIPDEPEGAQPGEPQGFFRRLFHPLMKLLFNPAPLITALQTQTRINRDAAARAADGEE